MSLTPSTTNPEVPTYQAVFDVTGPIGQAATILGSATATICISNIFFTTPGATVELTIRKQSTASTGGTSTVVTGVPLSSTNAAATAVVRQYTVAPTPGTLVGNLAVDTVSATDRITYAFGANRLTQPLYLRGVAQQIALEISASTAVQGYFQWYELPS